MITKFKCGVINSAFFFWLAVNLAYNFLKIHGDNSQRVLSLPLIYLGTIYNACFGPPLFAPGYYAFANLQYHD